MMNNNSHVDLAGRLNTIEAKLDRVIAYFIGEAMPRPVMPAPEDISTLDQINLTLHEWGVGIGNGQLADGSIKEEIAARLLNIKPNTFARQVNDDRSRIPYRRVAGHRYYKPSVIAQEIERNKEVI